MKIYKYDIQTKELLQELEINGAKANNCCTKLNTLTKVKDNRDRKNYLKRNPVKEKVFNK